MGSPPAGDPWESQKVAQRAVGEPSVNTQAQFVDFLVVYLPAKYALVEGLTKSWVLTPSGSGVPLKVIDEQVAIVEVRPSLSLLLFSLLFLLSLANPAELFLRPLLGR